MVAAQERAGRALAERGARLRRRRIPEFERSFGLWSAMMAEAADTSFRELLGEGEAIPVGRELLRWALLRSPHTLPALMLAAFEDARPFVPRPARRRKIVADGQRLRARMHALLGTRGLLLYPSHPRPAPRHFGSLLRPFDWAYTAIFNILELPVTQVPMGLSRSGLPLGVQVAAGAGQDHLSIAAAVALEQDFGGWVPPSAVPRPVSPARAQEAV